MMNGMLLPVRRRAGLEDEFFYNNARKSSNFVLKSKIQEMKELVIGLISNAPGVKG